MKKTLIEKTPIFKNSDEYANFAMKYNVYGKDAVALKKMMDKSAKMLEPVIRPGNRR